MAGTGTTIYSGGIFHQIILEAAQIWRELAPHYFLADSFRGGSDLAGTCSLFFSGRLFWRQLRFGGNWLHIIFRRIVFEAAQIWRELVPHYFPLDCFGGSSDLAGTGSTLFSGGLFWKQFRFGGNWLHIIFRRIGFGGSSELAGTGYTLFSGGLLWRQLDLAGTGSTLFSGGFF